MPTKKKHRWTRHFYAFGPKSGGAPIVTSYTDPVSVGNRNSIITVTFNGYKGASAVGSTPTQWLDGGFAPATSWWWLDQITAGLLLTFYFNGATVVIDEAKWYQGGPSTHGTWQWQGSNDGTNYTNIGGNFVLGGVTTQTLSTLSGNKTAYKYYRMLGISGNADDNDYIWEIEFKAKTVTAPPVYVEFTPQNMNNNVAPAPFVASASSEFSGQFQAYYAFNNAVGTLGYWLGDNPTGVDWLQLDIGAGNDKILFRYTIQVNSIPEPNRAPKNWTMLGSSNGSTWNVLDTVTNQTGWGNAETRTFDCDVTTTAYRYFRLNITANNGDTLTQVAELNLFTV